ncbi:MAG: murein transglycosylase A [Pseudorhodobacter sp.]
MLAASRIWLAGFFLGLNVAAAPAQMLEFSALEGWAEDDHRAALSVFLDSCDLLDGADWSPICQLAPQAMKSPEAARSFFELLFQPVQIGAPPALFTGYYEPELEGSLFRSKRFAYPIYSPPPELEAGEEWLTRAEIETTGALDDRGLELAWLDDPVDVFFLQVQGSGRIRLPSGRVIRVGYAGRNGHGYRSVGQEMIRQGLREPHEVSAQDIKDWVRENPEEGAALLRHNSSYVFFRRLRDLPAELGPIGAMGRSITTMRSLAVDPRHTPLGAPVWLDKEGGQPLQRLMVAQDTGGAIKGPQRADIFFGTGEKAGIEAGTIRDGGRMVVLLPIELAFAMFPDS